MTSNSSAVSRRAVLSAACDTAALGSLAYLVVSRVFYEDFGVAQEFGADRFPLIDGYRTTPSPARPRATVMFLGDVYAYRAWREDLRRSILESFGLTAPARTVE